MNNTTERKRYNFRGIIEDKEGNTLLEEYLVFYTDNPSQNNLENCASEVLSIRAREKFLDDEDNEEKVLPVLREISLDEDRPE